MLGWKGKVHVVTNVGRIHGPAPDAVFQDSKIDLNYLIKVFSWLSNKPKPFRKWYNSSQEQV